MYTAKALDLVAGPLVRLSVWMRGRHQFLNAFESALLARGKVSPTTVYNMKKSKHQSSTCHLNQHRRLIVQLRISQMFSLDPMLRTKHSRDGRVDSVQ